MDTLLGLPDTSVAAWGSYHRLFYAPLDDVEMPLVLEIIEPVSQFFVGQIIFKTQKNWKEMPIVGANRDWDIKQKDSKFRPRYTATVSGTLKDTSSAGMAELVRMEGRDFIVAFARPDAYKLTLIATPQYPATLSFDINGKNEPSNRSRTNFKFTAINPFGFAWL